MLTTAITPAVAKLIRFKVDNVLIGRRRIMSPNPFKFQRIDHGDRFALANIP